MRQDVNVYNGEIPKWFNVVHAVERCKRTQEVFFFVFLVWLFALILHGLRTKLQDQINPATTAKLALARSTRLEAE